MLDRKCEGWCGREVWRWGQLWWSAPSDSNCCHQLLSLTALQCLGYWDNVTFQQHLLLCLRVAFCGVGISDFTPPDLEIVGYRVFLGNGQVGA
jgi:hypothetical protein